jgi:hypothetical protein
MRPCDHIGAFRGGRSPLLELEHSVEAGQAGCKGVHFGAHDSFDTGRDSRPPDRCREPALYVEVAVLSLLISVWSVYFGCYATRPHVIGPVT